MFVVRSDSSEYLRGQLGARPLRCRSAFSLIELIITISLLATVFAIMVPLMNWSVTSTRAAQRAAAIGVRFDGMSTVLRADVSRASATELTTPKELSLIEPDGGKVLWKIGPGDLLTRGHQQWSDLGITDKTTFVEDGHAVRLVIPPRPDGTQKTLSFFCQTAALTGAKR